MRRLLASLLVTCGVGGCARTDTFEAMALGSSDDPLNCAAGSDCGGVVTLQRAADILFVIDNSGSMGEKQGTLASNFRSFIDVLEAENVGASYRIGVTSTDRRGLRATSCRTRLGEFIWQNRLGGEDEVTIDRRIEGCENPCQIDDLEFLPVSEEGETSELSPWIAKDGFETNIAGGVSIAEALECVGPQGISGDGFEAPLESMHQVLTENEFGFVRDDALLAVIFVTDEADCSMPLEYRDLFQIRDERTRALWGYDDRPSSATCWYAGVRCEGGPGRYDTCYAEDIGWDAQPTSPDQAVLYPVDRYVDALREISNAKQARGGNGTTLVAVIAGVPVDYPQTGTVIYQDSDVSEFNTEYGIGPGCGRGTESLVSPSGLPPVRLREFAEAFATEGRNLFSICDDDYAVALEAIATAIARLDSRACVPGCAMDTEPNVRGLQPSCLVVEDRSTADGGARLVPACTITNDGWGFPGESEICYRALTDSTQTTRPVFDDLSPQCVTRGANLEIVLERQDDASIAAGASVRVECEQVRAGYDGRCVAN